ncbi:hypothetical protein MKX03_026562 [Papaver bracteatum]|nr:hypothetical protein MKX03_026562 [Papaver bracteatum]
MRELRSGVRRSRSVAATVGEEGVGNRRRKKKMPLKKSEVEKQQEHDDCDVGGEVTATVNVLEEEPEEDQRIRTSPSIPYEVRMGKLEHLDILLNIIVRLPLLKDPQFVREHLNHAIEMNRFSAMILSYETQCYSDDGTDPYTVAYDPSLRKLAFWELVMK